MSKPMILVKREFWEHRVSFLWLPLVVTALCVFFMLAGLSLSFHDGGVTVSGGIEHHEDLSSERVEYENMPLQMIVGERIGKFAELPADRKAMMLDRLYLAVSTPLLLVLWIVVTMYFVGCLYQERKDRSVLFWKSMPVSDFQTVMSKLSAGMILAPLITLGCLMGLHLAMLIISVFTGAGHGVDVWQTFVAPAHLFQRWGMLMIWLTYYLLWSLPFFCWLVLVSSWARSAPLAWIIGVPVVAGILESILTAGNSEVIARYIASHVFPEDLKQIMQGGLSAVLRELVSLDYLVSLIVSAVMLYGAVIFRGKADEF